MTSNPEAHANEGPEGLIFLPGFENGFDVSGNPERMLSEVEFAILTGRGVFTVLREQDMQATDTMHEAFCEERIRILGEGILATVQDL